MAGQPRIVIRTRGEAFLWLSFWGSRKWVGPGPWAWPGVACGPQLIRTRPALLGLSKLVGLTRFA